MYCIVRIQICCYDGEVNTVQETGTVSDTVMLYRKHRYEQVDHGMVYGICYGISIYETCCLIAIDRQETYSIQYCCYDGRIILEKDHVISMADRIPIFLLCWQSSLGFIYSCQDSRSIDGKRIISTHSTQELTKTGCSSYCR